MNSNFSTEHTSFSSDMGPGPGGPPSTRIDIKRLLRENLPMILGILVVLFVPAAVAIWFMTPKEYEVWAELRFRASSPSVLDDAGSRNSTVPYNQFVTTQIRLITGPAILKRVLSNPAVREIPAVEKAPDSLKFVRSKVSASEQRNSELVKVSVRMQDREGAELLLTQIIEEYRDFAAREESEFGGKIREILLTEQTKQRTELVSVREEINDLYKQVGVPLNDSNEYGASETEAYRESLAKAEEDRSEAEVEIKNLEHDLEDLRELAAVYEKNPGKKIFKFDIESAVAIDARVGSVEKLVADTETELEILRQKYQDDFHEVADKERELGTLQSELERKKQTARGEIITAMIEKRQRELDMYKNHFEDAKERIQHFEQAIEQHREEALDASTTIARIQELSQKEEATRNRLQQIASSIDKVRLEEKVPARVTLASEPVVPNLPDSGKRLQLIVMAFGASLSAGLGAALWRELTNQKARSAQDLASITPLPILASIPDAKVEPFPKDCHVPLLTADYPHSPTADEYRRILARIIYPPDDTVEVNSCLIASATRGDGKTSVACNLAVSLAQANRRVLLVDVSPHDPEVEWSFGLEPADGLAEVLFAGASYQLLIRNTEFENLKVLGPGLSGDRLKGKLASREMMEFLEEVEKDFDHIIIDSPPALLMSDAKLLAPIVDAVVVVVGVGASTLGMVRRTLAELEQVNANLIGVILNRMMPTRGGYLRRNLELFYAYGDTNGRQKADRDIPEMRIAEEDGAEDDREPVVMLVSDEDEEKRGS